MTDCENEKLSKLVAYLIESEDWKYIWLNEYSEPIRLFMFKTGITFRRTKKYIDNSMNKLIGTDYNNTQSRLRRKIEDSKDLYFKQKSKQIKSDNNKDVRTLEPRTEFGIKYLEHYGYR